MVCATRRSRVFPCYVGYTSPDSPREAQTVRCFSRATATCHVNKNQQSYGAPDGSVPHRKGNMPIRDSLPSTVLILFTVRCASDSPVHLRTEGKNCLPNGAPTTPSYLGAIKGTPRRMEQYTKPPLNILRHLDSTNAHSDHRI
jgi:hypothetical protein